MLDTRQLTLGTAGHVDHGKTTLVQALTGKNTDRLPEERRRGLSIALGFAELLLDDGRSLSVVDVPGHERFVRTMVAGATGIDVFLMVVAADEGVMPQTLEHVAALRALGLERGVMALTKCDLVATDPKELADEQARALGLEVEAIAVSARSGEGLDTLLAALGRIASEVVEKDDGERADGPVILHVDRVFSLRGIGTVVTGTLWSGSIAIGDQVDVFPRGLPARVRSIQIHDDAVAEAVAGGRVALNLAGVSRGEVSRGDVIASRDSQLLPSYRLDAELRLEPGTASLDGKRVQVHHGTRDVAARVVQLTGDGLAQLRLQAPLIARWNDRFVVRTIAPPGTVGGGVVLDPAPPRHGAGPGAERLAAIWARGLAAVVADEAEAARAGDAKSERPEPGRRPGRLDPRAKRVLKLLEADGAQPRAPATIAESLSIEPRDAHRLLRALVEAELVIQLSPQVYYPNAEFAPLRARAVKLAREQGELTIAELRTHLGTSRKYAQALLAHLDSTAVTIRHGDRHVVRQLPESGPMAAPRPRLS